MFSLIIFHTTNNIYVILKSIYVINVHCARLHFDNTSTNEKLNYFFLLIFAGIWLIHLSLEMKWEEKKWRYSKFKFKSISFIFFYSIAIYYFLHTYKLIQILFSNITYSMAHVLQSVKIYCSTLVSSRVIKCLAMISSKISYEILFSTIEYGYQYNFVLFRSRKKKLLTATSYK